MKNDSEMINNIVILGDKYVQEKLSEFDTNKLESSWWEALKYLFWHSFMRGRRDELSLRYMIFAIDAIKKSFNFSDDSIDDGYLEILARKNEFKIASKIKSIKKKSVKNNDKLLEIAEKTPFLKALLDKSIEREFKLNNKAIKSIALAHTGDILMVLETLAFITEKDERKNIYIYIINKLKSNQSQDLYKELVNIDYVGDKIATFIFRDIYLLNPKLEVEKPNYIMSLDTWVNQIAKKMQCEGANFNETKENLIGIANENDVNVCKFAAGLWYLGTNSLDILIKNYINRYSLNSTPDNKKW